MLHVSDFQSEIELTPDVVQGAQQRNGIRPAGNGHQQSIAGSEKRIFPVRGPELFNDSHAGKSLRGFVRQINKRIYGSRQLNV
jgi:hypothetical protein